MADPTIRVPPEDLFISGATVEGHAMDPTEAHALADSRVETALAYLPGLAAAALEAKLAEWQATTASLSECLTSHATTFRASAVKYVDTDDTGAQQIAAVPLSGASSLRFA